MNRFSVWTLSSGLLVLCFNCLAQPASHVHFGTASQGAIGPSAMIDGRTHPDRITDLLAYRLVFLSLSEPADATPAQMRRQAAKLLPLQLDDQDRAQLLSAVATFQRAYSDLERRYAASQGSVGTHSRLSDFVAEQSLIVQTAQAALIGRMSAGGFLLLHTHIQREKSNMRVIPFPKM